MKHTFNKENKNFPLQAIHYILFYLLFIAIVMFSAVAQLCTF